MARFGFVGPAYTSPNVAADCQELINWYAEKDDSGAGKSDWTLLPCPGTENFAANMESPTRGGCTLNARAFVIGGTKFYELFADGTYNPLGTVENDSTLCYLAVSLTQIAIASAGHLYCYTLATGAFVEIDTTTGAALQGRVASVRYVDGYFSALLKNSNKLQLSGLLDGTAWNPLDIAQVSVFPDDAPAFIIDHREAIVFGRKATVVYADTGNPFFPFEVVPGAYIEDGIIAADSPIKLDNSTFWLSGDERGAGVAKRLNGYTPTRVSTHAQENEWQQYATLTDAVSYSYQDGGHTFWVLYFPTADKTWVYDIAAGVWHKRGRWVEGALTAHRSWWHIYAFGKHLVGDWNSGTIFDMELPRKNGSAWRFCDDAGRVPIRRVRRAPYIANENERTWFPSFVLEGEWGLGSFTDGDGNAVEPQIFLSWSDARGQAWTEPIAHGAGLLGQYDKIVEWLQLGQSKTGRVFEVSCSDAVPWRLTDAYVPPAVERLAAQMRKQA